MPPNESTQRTATAGGQPGPAERRALFLDRDGVINEETGYLYRPEEVRFVPGIFALLRTARELGYVTVVVTNQSGIARGLYTGEDFEALMRWMGERMREHDVALDAVYHCPYHPEHGVGTWRREHPDRKPSPGMLLRAAREHGLDLRRSVMVGDRCSDVEAANAAGVQEAMLLAGSAMAPGAEGCPGTYRLVRTLREVEERLRQLG